MFRVIFLKTTYIENVECVCNMIYVVETFSKVLRSIKKACIDKKKRHINRKHIKVKHRED